MPIRGQQCRNCGKSARLASCSVSSSLGCGGNCCCKPNTTPCGVLRVELLLAAWGSDLRPPSLADGVQVYLSAPLFSFSTRLCAVGYQGLRYTTQEVPTPNLFCNLSTAGTNSIIASSDFQGLDPYGFAGLCARRGWKTYCPVRDGFDVGLQTAVAADGSLTEEEKTELLSYLNLAIGSNDWCQMVVGCNAFILNMDGIQADDGSMAEAGMLGMRGLPGVIYKSQATNNFGPGGTNPMPLGCVSPDFSTAIMTTQQCCVDGLAEKIRSVVAGRSQTWESVEFAPCVPPPPLQVYFAALGAAVFLTKYKSMASIVTDENGILDTQESFTEFYYDRMIDSPTDAKKVEVAQKIMERMKAVEAKYVALREIWSQLGFLPFTCLPPAPNPGPG